MYYKFFVFIKKFFCPYILDTLLSARNGRNGFVGSSTYETDIEFGRGKRKKINRLPFECDSPPPTQMRKKTKTNSKLFETSDDSDSNSETELAFTSKKNVSAPPLVPFTLQNSKQFESLKHAKNESTKTKILEKKNNQSTINTSVLSVHNQKCRKDLLLQKINEAKEKCSLNKDRTEIIETARQRQKNDINKQSKLTSVLSQHNMRSSHKSTNKNSKPEKFSQAVSDDTEENIHTNTQWQDFSSIIEDKDEKFKENPDLSSTTSGNILHYKAKARSLIEANKENTSTFMYDVEKSNEGTSTTSHSDNQSGIYINNFLS